MAFRPFFDYTYYTHAHDIFAVILTQSSHVVVCQAFGKFVWKVFCNYYVFVSFAYRQKQKTCNYQKAPEARADGEEMQHDKGMGQDNLFG